MKTPDERDLIAKALRDGLSEAEKREWQQLLDNDLALQTKYAEEVALERALDQLPGVKISSNFTSLVLQQVQRSDRTPQNTWRNPLSLFQSVVARAVAGFVLVAVLGLGLGYRYRRAERADMALGVRSFTEVASALGSSHAPAAEVFENFEAIQRLSMPTDNEVDLELLVALQK